MVTLRLAESESHRLTDSESQRLADSESQRLAELENRRVGESFSITNISANSKPKSEQLER